MNVGVFLNQYYGPDGGFRAGDLVEQAQTVEAGGFDSITVGERHLHEEGFIEPLTALSAIAGVTDRVQLGTAAMLPALYEPLHLAERIATLDAFAEGRVAFGAAIGYRQREFEPFGIDRGDRVPRFIESLELLKRLWRDPSVTHDGQFWQYEDVFVSPRPSARIPIWIGGHADIAIKRAAYRGDAWIASASSTVEDLEGQIAVYEAALEEFGHDRAEHDVILMRDCFVADSAAAARDAVEPYLVRLYEWYARWGQTYLDEHDVAVEWDDLAGKFVLGPPADCIEALERYAAIGVDHILLRCQFPGQPQGSTLACLERLGDDVIPELP